MCLNTIIAKKDKSLQKKKLFFTKCLVLGSAVNGQKLFTSGSPIPKVFGQE
jgi:hypothetical protein